MNCVRLHCPLFATSPSYLFLFTLISSLDNVPDFNSDDEDNVPEEDTLAGVTTTRGGGQVNHSIDATPIAPRVRPVEPQGQSFFGYMASQLYSPAQGVQFSPAIESPLPEAPELGYPSV